MRQPMKTIRERLPKLLNCPSPLDTASLILVIRSVLPKRKRFGGGGTIFAACTPEPPPPTPDWDVPTGLWLGKERPVLAKSFYFHVSHYIDRSTDIDADTQTLDSSTRRVALNLASKGELVHE